MSNKKVVKTRTVDGVKYIRVEDVIEVIEQYRNVNAVLPYEISARFKKLLGQGDDLIEELDEEVF